MAPHEPAVRVSLSILTFNEEREKKEMYYISLPPLHLTVYIHGSPCRGEACGAWLAVLPAQCLTICHASQAIIRVQSASALALRSECLIGRTGRNVLYYSYSLWFPLARRVCNGRVVVLPSLIFYLFPSTSLFALSV